MYSILGMVGSKALAKSTKDRSDKDDHTNAADARSSLFHGLHKLDFLVMR